MNAKQVHNDAELVSYQEDSITSRILLKKDSGTITLFAFDRGQALSEHTTPFDALVQVVDGSAVIIIDGEEFTLRESEMILMPGNHPHEVRAEEKFKMILTMLRT